MWCAWIIPKPSPFSGLWKSYLLRNPAPGARKTGDYCYVISHHSKFLRDSQRWSCWLLFCSVSLLSCLAEMMLSSVKPLERAMRAKCVCVCVCVFKLLCFFNLPETCVLVPIAPSNRFFCSDGNVLHLALPDTVVASHMWPMTLKL